MSKEKLIIDHTFEEFVLFGIVSDVKEFKLAWQLNKFLDIDLILQEEMILEFKKEKSLSILFYESNGERFNVRLIKNLAVAFDEIKNPFLLPEIKNYDYLLYVEGEDIHDFDAQEWTEAIKNATFVQYISRIDIDKIKSVDNLMF